MAKARRAKPARRRDKKGGPGSGRRKSCPYCKDKIEQVDYKDVATLRRFVSERGKIRSRRISGACRRHQNQLATAVKRARELALLPYVSDAREERPERGGRGGGYRASARTASAMPEAILLKDVETLGEKGTVVDVSKGYLRNYLIPRKLAQPATKGAIDAAQRRPRPRSAPPRRPSAAPRERRAAQQDGAHDQPAGRRRRPPVRLGHHAGHRRRHPGGARHHVDRRKVHLDEPIRHVGTYMVVVEVADGVTATVKTIVTEP